MTLGKFIHSPHPFVVVTWDFHFELADMSHFSPELWRRAIDGMKNIWEAVPLKYVKYITGNLEVWWMQFFRMIMMVFDGTRSAFIMVDKVKGFVA